MFTFRKEERLYYKKDIDQLFNQGKSFRTGNFRVVWMPVEMPGRIPCRVLMVAGKRHLKKAVDRHRVTRLMREAFRLNKQELYDYLVSRSLRIHIAILYNGREVPVFRDVEHKIILILHRLILHNEESSG